LAHLVGSEGPLRFKAENHHIITLTSPFVGRDEIDGGARLPDQSGETNMSKIIVFGFVAGSLVPVAALAQSTPSAPVPFTFSGTRENSNPLTPPGTGRCAPQFFNTVTIAPGQTSSTGTSNLGPFTSTQSHCISSAPPTPISDGRFTYTFRGGDTITGTYTGNVASSSTPGSFSSVENLVITGGTGRFVAASGTITSQGVLAFANNTGNFTGDVSGSVLATTATASGTHATALGSPSAATGNYATAIGAFSLSGGERSLAQGAFAEATGVGATATGAGSLASASATTAIGEQAQATAARATAVGKDATASSINSVAVGSASVSSGSGAIAIGGINPLSNQATAATGNVSIAIGAGARTTTAGLAATAIGPSALASSDGAVAIGGRTQATGFEATALGSENIASGAESQAVGFRASASGLRALAAGSGSAAAGEGGTAVGAGTSAGSLSGTALGAAANASGIAASALGHNTVASGLGSTGVGVSARATGAGSTAVGRLSSATADNAAAFGPNAAASFANSTAIGAGAATTGVNQVALGGVGSAVRIGDIAASTAAQTGALAIATVDANGVVGRNTTLLPAIAALQSDQAAMSGRINTLFDLRDLDRTEMRKGVAAAVAMGHAAMPSAPGRTSFVLNGATFRDQAAVGGAFMHRLRGSVPLAIGGGFSFAGKGNNAFRAGVAGEF
jgi:autotransporter adhesin